MDLPLFLDLTGRRVVCVGGGPVAAGKVTPMIEAGADVTVIAPTVDDALASAARDVLLRPFSAGDVSEAADDGRPTMLAVAATGVGAVDDAVQTEADGAGIWCLRVAGPTAVRRPSVVRGGGVTIALTTGAPALTRALRQHVADVLAEGWGDLAEVLARLRADESVRAALAQVEEAERRRRWRDVVSAFHPTTGWASTADITADARRILLHG